MRLRHVAAASRRRPLQPISAGRTTGLASHHHSRVDMKYETPSSLQVRMPRVSSRKTEFCKYSPEQFEHPPLWDSNQRANDNAILNPSSDAHQPAVPGGGHWPIWASLRSCRARVRSSSSGMICFGCKSKLKTRRSVIRFGEKLSAKNSITGH